ncbi:MAG: hypothetical protein IGQ45_02270 [Cyanobacterium sp. T60_A2020_053]|nr:hypothetical protein [Cyanobacterium sp. T60_A2020_053]
MRSTNKASTTQMEVTSIRLEKTLKDSLKSLSGSQGYQTLIRDILWNYVQQKSGEYRPNFAVGDIRVTFDAVARKDESCVLTGKLIPEGEPLLLALTIYGDFVPVSLGAL